MRLVAFASVAFVALVLSACSGRPMAKAVADPFSGGYPTFRDEASGITAILGTPDLGVGTFRVALALNDRSGLIRFPGIRLESSRPGSSEVAEQHTATYFAFPDGVRGLYATSMTFDRAGKWTMTAIVPRPDGEARVTIPVVVAERASAPSVGTRAPASRNRIASDVPSLDRLTTGSTPDAATARPGSRLGWPRPSTPARQREPTSGPPLGRSRLR